LQIEQQKITDNYKALALSTNSNALKLRNDYYQGAGARSVPAMAIHQARSLGTNYQPRR